MNYNKIIIALAIILVVIAVAGIVVFNPFVAKMDSTVSITSASELNNGDNFSIILKDINGTPLANQVVNITIIDVNGFEKHQQVITDESGNGILPLNDLNSSEYSFNVFYGGNDKYNGCNITQKISIVKPIVSSNSNSGSSTQSDWVDSEGVHHFYENGQEYVGSREGQHMTVEQSNYVREHGMV